VIVLELIGVGTIAYWGVCAIEGIAEGITRYRRSR
jgi:hypothetical protein